MDALLVHSGLPQGLLGVLQVFLGELLEVIVVQVPHRLPVAFVGAEMPGHGAHAGGYRQGVLEEVLLGGGCGQQLFGAVQRKFFGHMGQLLYKDSRPGAVSRGREGTQGQTLRRVF